MCFVFLLIEPSNRRRGIGIESSQLMMAYGKPFHFQSSEPSVYM